jgi:hypothetical protein
MHRLVGAGAAMLAALAVTGVLAAGASAAPTGGRIALYADAGDAGSQKIVFVGAIGDYGTARNVDKNGKVDDNGNFVWVKLTKGAFEIDATAVNEAMKSGRPQVESKATCSATFSGTATVKFLHGTGFYKGISGTATVTVSYGGVGSRYKSGPKKGQCRDGDSNRRAEFGFVTGHGAVSFARTNN